MNDIAGKKLLAEKSVEEVAVATIRTLAMDAVQKAQSGHPGTPMALAPVAYVLYHRLMQHNPRNPTWFNRDRFILSAGHASMLLYASLYLTGYDVTLDDIKAFRQWDSTTPGHPEMGMTPGVETTTGPLGQGIMNAVGMAIAEAHLAAKYNRDGFPLVDHHTYVICSDGDMMEGASHEAASLAGHLGLGKLIVLYDDNRITIDGSTALTFTDDIGERFRGYHWHVQELGEQVNDLEAVTRTFETAQQTVDRPSLIIARSHIAYGAPKAQDTPKAHGAALGEDEVKATKRFYGWPEEPPFYVPDAALEHMREATARGERLEHEWNELFARYRKTHPDAAAQFEAALAGELPAGWEENLPCFDGEAAHTATRVAGGKALNHFAEKIPWIVGGSSDLASSTNAYITSSGDIQKGDYAHRNVHWGVREHVMCAACSGMALHGGVRPYASTFFIFTDYARPAIRLAALMELPIIYAMTHDSIGLGEDGPTHQPVEHLASFRAMPNMCVIRPADANETVYAWRVAIARKNGPTMLVLSRQGLSVFDRGRVGKAAGLMKGAYVLSKERGEKPDAILIATGSEVQLAAAVQGHFWTEDELDVRVVSMPSWELFRSQPKAYRDEVLPPGIEARLAIEAGSPFGWCEWTGEKGSVIGIGKFGASAPGKINFEHYGFTIENVMEQTRRVVGRV